MSSKNCLQILEAILFIENKPVSYQELSSILELNMSSLLQVVDELHFFYAQNLSGLELVDDNKYLSLKPKDDILEYLKDRYKGLQEKKLTQTMFSVLGIIAYKGPLTRGEVDKIRGIDSSYAIKRLLQEGLIELAGKKDIVGSPNLYATSNAFLTFFKLKSLKDLPNIEDFQSLYTDS